MNCRQLPNGDMAKEAERGSELRGLVVLVVLVPVKGGGGGGGGETFGSRILNTDGGEWRGSGKQRLME